MNEIKLITILNCEKQGKMLKYEDPYTRINRFFNKQYINEKTRIDKLIEICCD